MMKKEKRSSFPSFLLRMARSCVYTEKLLKQELEALPEGFTVTAHTGCMGTKENSIEAILQGEKYADIVEFDLNFGKDGAAVLSHDEPQGGEVTLDEAFRVISKAEKLRVNVDIKSDQRLSEIQRLAEIHGVCGRFFLTGVDRRFLAAVQRDCPGIPYYLNVSVDRKKRKNREYLQSLADEVRLSGAIGINFNKKAASRQLVEVFHLNGLLVSVWTVNTRRSLLKIVSYGPDNITTRHPEYLK